MKSSAQWFSLVVGIVLILVGIDNWAHIVPGVQLGSGTTAMVVIVVGLVGLLIVWKGKGAVPPAA